MSKNKAKKLRELLVSDKTDFLLEAHNGISAKIVEKSGFKGIWASSLALSAQFGVRDNNEASWSQIVDMLEFMSDATNIPILLDGDTGYGNFNNMRRLVKKLEQRQIGGVCIEDKEFPKTNSFIQGERQPLAKIGEFCSRIKAGKDSQENPDFCIIARLEGFITGWGLTEVLKRAEHYHAAGADAILVHSKESTAAQVLDFVREWAGRTPVVIIPTKYYSTPTQVFEKAKINLVIWANHMIRASVSTMEKVSAEIHTSRAVTNIEDQLTPIKALFKLQGADELLAAEERYLKTQKKQTTAIVLAAGRGGLGTLTHTFPKVMLKIGRRTLLARLMTTFKKNAIGKTILVAGYKANKISKLGIDIVINKNYDDSSELMSLNCAKKSFAKDMVITYGDLLYRSYILNDLLATEGDIVTVVDSACKQKKQDYAFCDKEDNRSIFEQDVKLHRINSEQTHSKQAKKAIQGKWVGLIKIQNQGKQWLKQALDELMKREDFAQLSIPDLLNHIVALGYPVKVHYIHGHWLDINSVEDLNQAMNFTQDDLE